MLIGQYLHSIDPKGRIIMPSKLREDLGDKFIVTRGLDRCLFAYSMKEWGVLEDKIRSLPLSKARDLQRFFFANAAEAETDGQGRILIPSVLREYAGLTKDVVVIGSLIRAEIWDKDRWNEVCNALTPEAIESAMTELGF